MTDTCIIRWSRIMKLVAAVSSSMSSVRAPTCPARGSETTDKTASRRDETP